MSLAVNISIARDTRGTRCSALHVMVNLMPSIPPPLPKTMNSPRRYRVEVKRLGYAMCVILGKILIGEFPLTREPLVIQTVEAQVWVQVEQ